MMIGERLSLVDGLEAPGTPHVVHAADDRLVRDPEQPAATAPRTFSAVEAPRGGRPRARSRESRCRRVSSSGFGPDVGVVDESEGEHGAAAEPAELVSQQPSVRVADVDAAGGRFPSTSGS